MNNQAPIKPDWPTIRAYHESSDDTLRQVAERFEVPFDTVKKRSSREKWHKGADAGMAQVPENGTDDGTATGTSLRMAPPKWHQCQKMAPTMAQTPALLPKVAPPIWHFCQKLAARMAPIP